MPLVRLAVLSLAVLAVGLAAAGEPLLEAFDQARFLSDRVTGLTFLLISESQGEAKEALVRIRFRDREDGTYVRIEFLSPEEQAGQVFLVTPTATFLWQPELFSPIKVGGTQAAFGDAAVAQISGIRFAEDYVIESTSDTIDERGAALRTVALSARAPEIPFQAITVYADAGTLVPVRYDLRAVTGVVLYRVFIDAYDEIDGDAFASAQIIENALIEGNRTTLRVVDTDFEAPADELFDPERLGEG